MGAPQSLPEGRSKHAAFGVHSFQRCSTVLTCSTGGLSGTCNAVHMVVDESRIPMHGVSESSDSDVMRGSSSDADALVRDTSPVPLRL